MDFMRCGGMLAMALLLAVLLVMPPGHALAGEEVRIRSAAQVENHADDAAGLKFRLKTRLMKENGLSLEEVEALDPLLEEALRLNGGDMEPVRKMVRKAVQVDCVGECLMERLRTQNRIMLQKREDPGTDGQLATRDRERTRARTRDEEQSGDATQTRTQTQTREGAGSEGGGKGSMGR